ncbi:MAG: uracil-DNA glycosylase family protein [Planctomycetaceae bacterium]|nr:uracil-DNA glycosylase family protein [Planctomycetaceae bacterium]
MSEDLSNLLTQIRSCTACAADLPCGPRPIVAAGATARILIIGQAPGIRVHQSGVPWDDPSGNRLREWMGVTSEDFYDECKVALVPMGFCYPGTGTSGDLPPRSECAELWHESLLSQLNNIRLTLVIGQYAQKYRLGSRRRSTLTKTVQAWQDFTPDNLPLPHPSPRNNRWLKKNAWFETDVLPYLQRRVKRLI